MEDTQETKMAHDFEVVSGNVMYPSGPQEGRPVEGYMAIYRRDNGLCLGQHSDNYGIVQYQDVKECVDNAIEFYLGEKNMNDVGLKFQSQTFPATRTKVDGGKCIMNWSLPMFQETEVKTGDILAWDVRIKTSHDGSWSVEPETGVTRVACMNGWTTRAVVKRATLRHTKHINIETIVKALNNSLEDFRMGVNEYGFLFRDIRTQVTCQEGLNMIENLFGHGRKSTRKAVQSIWAQPTRWNNIPDERHPLEGKTWHNHFHDNNRIVTLDEGTSREEAWKFPQRTDQEATAAVGDLFNCITQHLTHEDGSLVKRSVETQRVLKELIDFCAREDDKFKDIKLTGQRVTKRKSNRTPKSGITGYTVRAHRPLATAAQETINN